MGIKIIRAESTDKTAWNSFVSEHSGGGLYHLFEWQNVFREGYGLETEYLMALREGVVCGILPLVKSPVFLGKYVLISLPYCDFAGVLADETETAATLCQYARIHAEKDKQSLQIRQLGHAIPDVASNRDNLLQTLAIRSSEEELMTSFSRKLRWEIRKSIKNGIIIHQGLEWFDAFYGVYQRHMHDLGTPQHSKRYLQSIITYFPTSADLLVAEYQGRIIGGMFLMRWKDRVRNPWTSTLRPYNRLYVSYSLYYQALCYGVKHELKVFDFGRSQYHSGVFRFKQKWGCRVEQLYYHDYKGNTQGYADKRGYRFLSGLWKKTPCSITNMAGQYVRKYLH